MRLTAGRCLVRLRDHKEFKVVEATDYSDAKTGVSQIYRLASTRGEREQEYSNDVELESSRTRFRVVALETETFRFPR